MLQWFIGLIDGTPFAVVVPLAIFIGWPVVCCCIGALIYEVAYRFGARR